MSLQFNDMASSSIYRTSLRYAFRSSGASVRAPCSGGVVCAGKCRTYGRMVILNCGRHYRFILAGLSELSVDTGQDLTKGAPIGHMGNAGSSARLFIQLRHGQQSINPAPFL